MIEQLVSLNASQGLSGIEAANNPLSANTNDVTKFNMALGDQKIDNHALLDVRSKSNDGLLQIQQPQGSSSIIKMDQEYKVILDKLQEPAQFDKHWNVQKPTDNKPVFRSNTGSDEAPSLTKSLDGLLTETKESHKVAAGIMKDMRQWGLRTTIWSTNVNVLTAIVGQTSSAFKALFHSAG